MICSLSPTGADLFIALETIPEGTSGVRGEDFHGQSLQERMPLGKKLQECANLTHPEECPLLNSSKAEHRICFQWNALLNGACFKLIYSFLTSPLWQQESTLFLSSALLNTNWIIPIF